MSQGQTQRAKIISCTPSFSVNSITDAKTHYVTRLGFNLDWEWQNGETGETVMQVSWDNLKLFLLESEPFNPGQRLNIYVSALAPLVEEWNRNQDKKLSIVVEPPYDLPTAYIQDADGNVLSVQEAQSDTQHSIQQTSVDTIVAQLTNLVSADQPLPSAGQIMNEFGVTAGVAHEALSRYLQSG